MHFIRHGQSHFNLAMRLHGRDPGVIDAPLTEQGFDQARRAARELSGQGIKTLIASPYTRALQTASVIAEEIDVPIHVEPLVGERRVYSCDIGTPISVLKQTWPHLDFSHIENDLWWPQEDEEHTHLADRVRRFKSRWKKKLEQGRYALVSHYYFINGLSGHSLENGEVAFKKLF